ncbi:MAG: extracellular solute-binding protein [Candidatus Eremiobacteraeota bacterium]|nr:extracellular solute-binding protein [Candidatus Eremiobacteraeota bacterium]
MSAAGALAPVSVLYAGSLVTPMEGPVAAALRAQGIEFRGEPGGSKKLANYIAAGVRSPDAFIAVDESNVARLGARVATSTAFAQTALGIAWSDKTRFAVLLSKLQAGRASLLDVLATPELKIGRTDPQLDPKGVYTIAAMKELAGAPEEQRLLGDDENSAQIFPEEDLLARLDTGEIDVGFFYRTEAVARGYHFVALPAARASRVTYILAVMRDAPHPEQAQAFARFILYGTGRQILQQAGVEYLIPPDTR